MDNSLRLSQTQKMTLTPQMREYLKLLHLPSLELRAAVDEALESNPILEEAPPEPFPEAPDTSDKSKADDPDEENDVVFSGDWDSDQPLDFLSPPKDFGQRDQREARKAHDFQESLITKPESLFDFLEWQINFLDLSSSEKKIAEQIIGNITPDGYLSCPIEDIQKTARAGLEKVQSVLAKIQTLDPAGIGARDLREALLIQLERKGPEAALTKAMVQDHLDLVAKKSWQTLSKLYSRSEQEIKKSINLIAHLDPKPGRSFYAEEPIAITPEATVSIKDSGHDDLEIKFHDEHVPVLKINAEYRRMLREKETDPATKKFLKTNLASGMDFIKALELRRSTIQVITEELVREQPLFFTRGFSNLRPLRLKDIAQKLDLHESTVSRAIHGKYLATPQGTIAYKNFFSQKIETCDGMGESQKSIMEKIKSLIDNENSLKPLSDQSIVNSLKTDGIQIARRTVAKYRDSLKILPTHLRKK